MCIQCDERINTPGQPRINIFLYSPFPLEAMAPVLAMAMSAAFAAILPDAISNGTISAVRSNMLRVSKARWVTFFLTTNNNK